MFDEIKIDTFSANSLKVLDRDIEEFKNKYICNLTLFKKDKRAILGQKFHSLISSYLSGFSVDKMLSDLDKDEFYYWMKLESILREKTQDKNAKFIETEYSFLIKDVLGDKNYYLTGRFDAIYKNQKENSYVIYDWKTLNLPLNPEDDLQSVVYLYCAYKIYKTTNIKIRYFSIEKLDFIDILFKSEDVYKNRIENIILKLYKSV